MNELRVGKFTIDVSRGNISVTSPDGAVEVTPGEVDKVKSILGLALKLENLKVLPPSIGDPPWGVYFSEDGSCELKKEGDNTGCRFKFREGDDLIRAVEIGLTKVVDELRLGGGAKPGISGMSVPDPIIVGRH